MLLCVRRPRLRPSLRRPGLRELRAKVRDERRVADVVVEDDSGRLGLDLRLDGSLNLRASHLSFLRPSQRLLLPLRERPHQRLGRLVLGVFSRGISERDAGPLAAIRRESFSLFHPVFHSSALALACSVSTLAVAASFSARAILVFNLASSAWCVAVMLASLAAASMRSSISRDLASTVDSGAAVVAGKPASLFCVRT